MQGNVQINSDWCPFCGGRLKPTTKVKKITYEGKLLNIHKNEYREFQETGLLKYIDGPRSHPFSQDFIDLSIMLSVFVAIGLYFLWTILNLGA